MKNKLIKKGFKPKYHRFFKTQAVRRWAGDVKPPVPWAQRDVLAYGTLWIGVGLFRSGALNVRKSSLDLKYFDHYSK